AGRLQELRGHANVISYDYGDIASRLASGSSAPDGMVVIPASMGTLGRVATGVSDSLITRTAEVTLKEKRTLILVPRECPYSRIHLQNMLTLDMAGALILPASPGFYHKPKSVNELLDFITAKILTHLGVEQDIVPEWVP
ncbi:MAG: UbiX family flavin prenyltransferase, partial [Nitrospinota bacterium]